MKNLLFLLAVSTIFVTGGYLLGKNRIPEPSSPTAKESNIAKNETNVKTKFQQLSDIDLVEYQQLKNQKAKYFKANEILQKILKIFLLDLGLRISDNNYDFLKQNFDAPSHTDIDESVSSKLNSNSSGEEILAAVKNNFKEQVGSKKWAEKENKIAEISNDEDAKKFLKSVEIKDFFKSLKSLESIDKKQFNVISGSFWGKANVFVKNKNVVWDVEFEVTDTTEGEELSADVLLKMFQDGKRFSKSTGDGSIKHFNALSGSKLAIIVNIFGGDGYFQLYEADRMNALIGNYYHKQSIGDFKKVGTVHLERR